MKAASVVVALLAALLAGTGCSKGPSEDQCKQLLSHLIDLEFKKSGAGVATSTDAVKAEQAKQKAAVLESKSPEFLSTCSDKMARSRVECALAATDLDQLAKCDASN